MNGAGSGGHSGNPPPPLRWSRSHCSDAISCTQSAMNFPIPGRPARSRTATQNRRADRFVYAAVMDDLGIGCDARPVTDRPDDGNFPNRLFLLEFRIGLSIFAACPNVHAPLRCAVDRAAVAPRQDGRFVGGIAQPDTEIQRRRGVHLQASPSASSPAVTSASVTATPPATSF